MATISGVLGSAQQQATRAGEQIGMAIPYAMTALAKLFQDMEREERAQESHQAAMESHRAAMDRFAYEKHMRTLEELVAQARLESAQRNIAAAETQTRIDAQALADRRLDRILEAQQTLAAQAKTPEDKRKATEALLPDVRALLELPNQYDAEVLGGPEAQKALAEDIKAQLEAKAPGLLARAKAAERQQRRASGETVPLAEGEVGRAELELRERRAAETGGAREPLTLSPESQADIIRALAGYMRARQFSIEDTSPADVRGILPEDVAGTRPDGPSRNLIGQSIEQGTDTRYMPTVEERASAALQYFLDPSQLTERTKKFRTVEYEMRAPTPGQPGGGGAGPLVEKVLDLSAAAPLALDLSQLGVEQETLNRVMVRLGRGEDVQSALEAEKVTVPDAKSLQKLIQRDKTLREAMGR